MESSCSGGDDVLEIYQRYCAMIVLSGHRVAKQAQDLIAQFVESRSDFGEKLFDDLFYLMSRLNLSADSHHFTCFYDFVFFLCREKGQKNISVPKAIHAWRLVLTGRFRLLNHWCDFVQNHQRHNISLDTWQQILGFSRYVNEDLEGYDPKGAWPVLIDEFVEHMYRVNKTVDGHIGGDRAIEEQTTISVSFSGLNLLPGSKRKSPGEEEMCEESKRSRSTCHVGEPLTYVTDDNLPKAYDSHFLMGCCLEVGNTCGISLSPHPALPLSNRSWQ